MSKPNKTTLKSQIIKTCVMSSLLRNMKRQNHTSTDLMEWVEHMQKASVMRLRVWAYSGKQESYILPLNNQLVVLSSHSGPYTSDQTLICTVHHGALAWAARANKWRKSRCVERNSNSLGTLTTPWTALFDHFIISSPVARIKDWNVDDHWNGWWLIRKVESLKWTQRNRLKTRFLTST